MVRLPLADREQAGRLLGRRLAELLGGEPVVVLGLPRGGVIVAAAVAAELGAPLDAFGVRKLPLPGRPELAMGAIAGGGVLVWNDVGAAPQRPRPADVAAVVERERAELARREAAYRGDRPPPELAGRTVGAGRRRGGHRGDGPGRAAGGARARAGSGGAGRAGGAGASWT